MVNGRHSFINSESRGHLPTGSPHILGCTEYLAVSGTVRDPQTNLWGPASRASIHIIQVNLSRDALVSSVD